MNDPLHEPGLAGTHWSTANVGEALPGIATPLGWTIWESGADRMCREVLYALGVMDADELSGPGPGEDPTVRVFHGRIAIRVEWVGLIGDRMPLTSAEDAIGSMLGHVPKTMSFTPTRSRYATIAAKLPVAAARSPRRIRALARATETWWERELAQLPTASEAEARQAVRDGAVRFRETMTIHGIGLFSLTTPLIETVGKIVARAGIGDLGALSGSGGAEMELVGDLWQASRARLSLAEVTARHGYHGPHEGEISSRVWREDPAPLARMLELYAARNDDQDPTLREARARAALPALQREVAAQFPRALRPAVLSTLSLAARLVPLRGVGKAAFLQSLDVARAASRRLGETLAADGRLADPSDAFYLTLDELTAATLPADVHEVVTFRRERRSEHAAVRLPGVWRGAPEVMPLAQTGERVRTLTGVGASAGVVEGVARVVHDPSFADVEDGEVLVAHTTDPSWASIMFVSAALVVDIGGMVSHAAVVARELGIPCVVNTHTGTTAIQDGDRVRVDGNAGTVEVLS